ncbi:MAG: hypothetical protein IJR36_03895 [Lachnospiraceae bacterium]|nr:hypothetical protein [Lachnospiraceae bacterium]MBQ9562842.1 hypothetical protein [Lachnospiraceae bacterium]MBQ9592999.1 hypothetical protein [Lachnospiraceae bacterium]MBR0154119.1 hypothetical protein [Lachnospiraceae bacterium]
MKPEIQVKVLSFGYKYGLPAEASIIFDMRFLPNPYWVEELRDHNGLEPEVAEYVMSSGEGEIFLRQAETLLSWMLPGYAKKGISQIVIGVGCTGGQHRSVAMAHALAERLAKAGCAVTEEHRELSLHG